MAREAFAQYTAATSTCPKAVAPPLPAESKVSVAQLAKWRGSSVMVGVGTPPYGTDGFLQAQLIYTLLEGEQGRLAHDEELSGGFGLNRLMNRREDAPSVTVLAPMAMPRPLLIAHMMTAPRLMEPVREALLTHFLSFTTRPPAPEELTVAKQRLTNAYAMMQLSRLNLAKAVNCYEVYGQDYRRLWNTEKAIEAIKAEDLARLTREHFQTHAIGLLLPGDEE
jgi:predicted Zn-dependent peptidase